MVLIYLISGIAWIFIGDRLFGFLSPYYSYGSFVTYQSIKGIAFVILTAGILFFLIRNHLKKSGLTEVQYRRLFAANPNPMWIYDCHDLRFLEVNAAAIEMYQYNRSEFLGMKVTEILPEEEYEQYVPVLKDPELISQAPHYWNNLKKGGQKIIVSVRMNEVDFNYCEKCALAMVTDVTERVLHQQKLEISYKKELELNRKLEDNIQMLKKSDEENKKLAEVINKIHSLVVICNKDVVIQWVNHAFEKFTGYSAEEAIGRHPWDLLEGPKTDKDTLLAFIRSVKKKRVFSAEMIGYTKQKEEYWSQIDISPFYDEEGEVQGFISVENIVNDRKESEEKIREQNNTLREVAWYSSHEIRKPVSSILSLINLLKSPLTEEERDECLSLLESCSSELDEIVKGIAKKVNSAEK